MATANQYKTYFFCLSWKQRTALITHTQPISTYHLVNLDQLTNHTQIFTPSYSLTVSHILWDETTPPPNNPWCELNCVYSGIEFRILPESHSTQRETDAVNLTMSERERGSKRHGPPNGCEEKQSWVESKVNFNHIRGRTVGSCCVVAVCWGWKRLRERKVKH